MSSPTLTLELWSDYTADSPLHHEGLTDVTVVGIDPDRSDPILVDTEHMKGHIPLHKFCATVTIPEKYEDSGARTKFVPRGVVMTTQELFDSDYCHFCDSILDHHHHVSYRPETVLPVCQSCHGKVHDNSDFQPDLTPETERPSNYDSSFKRLWKGYRRCVGDTKFFTAKGGFDHKPPTLPRKGVEDVVRRMGLIGGGVNG